MEKINKQQINLKKKNTSDTKNKRHEVILIGWALVRKFNSGFF